MPTYRKIEPLRDAIIKKIKKNMKMFRKFLNDGFPYISFFLGIIETPVPKKECNTSAQMDRDIFFVFLAPPGPPCFTCLW